MAVCPHGTNKQWLELSQVDLHLKKAKKSLHGRKIVQISDLHYSKTVSSKYLRACVKKINELQPDLVVMTGDYITHDVRGRYSGKISEILKDLKAKSGVYASLGNHDYGIEGYIGTLKNKRVEKFIDNMKSAGIEVLRNESADVELNGQLIHLVGLGDIWANDFDPEKSFKDVSPDVPTIALTHNPHSVEHLQHHHFDTALCGHTHGSRFIFTPATNWPFVRKTEHQYHHGLYRVGDKSFYVNRGLGRIGRARFGAPPEITIYNLQ